MEENKYYTPEIDEFHVGFGFEDSYGDEEYAKNSIDQLNIKDVISSFLEKEAHIRVKCLDKEDLIELGFDSDYMEVGLESFRHKTFSYIEICVRHTGITIINNGRIIFDGVIKNKSELIKVLKMLGIK